MERDIRLDSIDEFWQTNRGIEGKERNNREERERERERVPLDIARR